MDTAVVSDGAVAPVRRSRLARASVWTGASAVGAWVFGAGAFLLALALRGVPDQVMAAVLACVGLSVCLALVGIVLALAALLRHEGAIALAGLGLSLASMLLVYLAPALGIVAGASWGERDGPTGWSNKRIARNATR